MWDAIIYVAHHDGIYDTPTSEFIAVNHDIDTEQIGRHYMRNIQRHYDQEQRQLDEYEMPEDVMQSRFTQVKHAYPFDTHPNIARVILWSDFICRSRFPGGCYEEGCVIPLSQYARNKGFDPEAKTYETERLVSSSEGIMGTFMDTLPCRYIERLGKHGRDEIWTDDSFTATDKCRGELSSPDHEKKSATSNFLAKYTIW